jgi:hypothetical protein
MMPSDPGCIRDALFGGTVAAGDDISSPAVVALPPWSTTGRPLMRGGRS